MISPDLVRCKIPVDSRDYIAPLEPEIVYGGVPDWILAHQAEILAHQAEILAHHEILDSHKSTS